MSALKSEKSLLENDLKTARRKGEQLGTEIRSLERQVPSLDGPVSIMKGYCIFKTVTVIWGLNYISL